MKSNDTGFFFCLGALIGAGFLFVTGVLLEGLVLQQLWGWFMQSTFGLPALSVPVALGIAVTVRMLTYKGANPKSPERSNKSWGVIVAEVYIPIFSFLAMGWLFHLFMR